MITKRTTVLMSRGEESWDYGGRDSVARPAKFAINPPTEKDDQGHEDLGENPEQSRNLLLQGRNLERLQPEKNEGYPEDPKDQASKHITGSGQRRFVKNLSDPGLDKQRVESDQV